ncbi:Alpha/Beta hydrolase protein [Microdochium bolleyi]|uniref:Kynurenine formamidase n=1 Tax=Microdochium bolleyi TaxID=196109 RepID=A0A136J799_9PEZI|nr:Alpha/Beta hydrolase protein [Microdochium bolleyi]
MASSLAYKVHHYAPERDLQQVGVWPVDLEDKSKYWIIYIHGGAWQDPEILHKTFVPSIDKILASTSSKQHIAAFASIDYCLSPYPSAPQDPSTTPAAQLRDAHHPDHVRDVAAALAYLQAQYGFGSRYVLLGHSAGATLTFQAVAGLASGAAAASFAHPAAAIGLCGIYDLNALWDRMKGTYTFIESVFGPDRKAWDLAAPARFSGDYSQAWQPLERKPVVILASSSEDELIDEPEVELMAAKVQSDQGLDYILVKDMRGKHDDVWLDGAEVARIVLLALEKLTSRHDHRGLRT